MKKILLLICSIVLFGLSAQEEETVTLSENYQNFVKAVQTKDIPLLKQTLKNLKKQKEYVLTAHVIPIIKDDMESTTKLIGILGAASLITVDSLYSLKKLKSPNSSIVSYFVRNLTELAAFKIWIYWIYRKNYQILNLLIENVMCIKNYNEVVIMEQLRRHCVPLICIDQERLFKKIKKIGFKNLLFSKNQPEEKK